MNREFREALEDLVKASQRFLSSEGVELVEERSRESRAVAPGPAETAIRTFAKDLFSEAEVAKGKAAKSRKAMAKGKAAYWDGVAAGKIRAGWKALELLSEPVSGADASTSPSTSETSNEANP